MPPKEKYTDPELRDEVKEEVKQSDKGGAPGQWSARKAQFMASEYKKRGGDYNTDKKDQDESQKNLSKWSDEDWQTKEGSGYAKQDDGTEKRYLPKRAWEKMTEQEKQATDEKKQEGSKEGKQFVPNTEKARQSRKNANEKGEDHDDEGKQSGVQQEQQHRPDGQEGADNAEGDDIQKDEEDEYQDEDGNGEDEEEEAEDVAGDAIAKAGDKRKKSSTSKQSNGSSKKQKSTSKAGGKGGNAPSGKVGSKHMDAEEPAPRGSNDRLPKKDQKIVWKAMPGYVDGQVIEVLTRGKKVDGKDVKASENDPKIVMKSKSSGKICVHKPESCFYD